MNRVTSICFAVMMVSANSAMAENVQNCDHALIRDTYSIIDSQFTDWRMAEQVQKDTYDKITHDGSTNAVIYGVPVGATYSDFKENIKKYTIQGNHSHRIHSGMSHGRGLGKLAARPIQIV